MSFASLQTMAPAGFARRWVMHGVRWVMTLTWAACAFMSVAQAAPKTAAVRAWITTTDQVHLLASAPAQAFGKRAALDLDIEVDAQQRFQTMVGFGANITDASAWLIQQRMSPTQRKALLDDLFGKPPGIGLSFTRLTIGASDFSRSHYSLDDVPAGESDFAMERFSIEPMRADVLPVVHEAQRINPALQIMASPWSAPAWMKSSGSLVRGTLRPEAYGAFAAYLGKFADAMQAEGLPLFALTLQNEPHFEPEDYPGMRLMPTARAQLIAEHVGPLLARRAQPVKLLDWDHNWDEFNAPLQVLADPRANRFVAGVAWHCYGGEVSAQSKVHAAYPDKETYFTECSGGQWKPHWRETLPWFMRHLIIGTTRGWAKGVLLWNIALDENHGPHLGGCKDCRGVVTIDSRSGAVTRNFDYYALAHASRFVRPGAVRIGSTGELDGLESVAFQNTDDQSIALIVLNGASRTRKFSISFRSQRFHHAMEAASVATFVWTGRPE